jgi:preprotein translocase subunit SecA
LDPVETSEEYETAWREERPKVEENAAAEARQVMAVGGLYVVGTERHESRRIDNQLRGRSGRQGDPGETRFYLSLGDELMRRFSDVNLEKLLTRLKMPDDEPIQAGVVTRAIQSAQTRVEQQNFDLRKNVLDYDEVLNQQRTVIYAARQRVLQGDNLREQVLLMIRDVITAYVAGATAERRPRHWDLDALWAAVGTLYPVGIEHTSVIPRHAKPKAARLLRKRLLDALIADARTAFARREAEVEAVGGQGAMRELERDVILDAIDRKWREHLYEMDYLKEGIGLRAMAERDPVVEYRREGYDMFVAMLGGLKEDCVGALFHAKVRAVALPPDQSAEPPVPKAEPASDAAEPSESGRASPLVGAAGLATAPARHPRHAK